MSETRPVEPYERPERQGLFDPNAERDACGVGFIVDMKGRKSHKIVADALQILENLEHRGAVGADPLAGDGAGILIQIPHEFLKSECEKVGFTLPAPGEYAVGHVFAPRDPRLRHHCNTVWSRILREENLQVLGWRKVPVDNSCLSEMVKGTEPDHRQVFIAKPKGMSEGDFERKLYLARKIISNSLQTAYKGRDIGHYTVCLSSRTLVYKGMFLSYQVKAYYKDLSDPRLTSALALVHQRFSTNTFPSWKLAHPYRMVAHNGEINTLRGNVNWMAARQASVSSPLYGADISKLWPISYEGQSDTACFDNALEFLVMGGYSLAHAAMMLIPEAWAGNPMMDQKRRAFYEYHAALMEPWDGPAAVAFTDGKQIGATLDRNGLRPARYLVTKDDVVIMSSESGVLPVKEEAIVQKWRLQPGKMLLIDLEKGRIIADDELKAEIAVSHPYEQWVKGAQIKVHDLPLAKSETEAKKTNVSLLDLQQAFGYTQESTKFLMAPMAERGEEAIGSMGNDTPISALSSKSKLLHTYFKQNFAQVTNPPIDSIREELVMSLVSFIGPRPNILDLEGTSKEKRLEVDQPILTNEDLERIRQIAQVKDNDFSSITIDITFDASRGPAGMGPTLDCVCAEAEEAVRSNEYNIIILSDRAAGPDRVPIPSLLATSAVHHHLIKQGLRTSVGLVVETGEAYEVHQFCTLAGYGAEAINPYLAFETLEQMLPQLGSDVTPYEVKKRYIKAIGKAMLKVMAKMGISTYQSYCGAQIFDAIGLKSSFVQRYFTGTHTQIEGIGLKEIAVESCDRHTAAFGNVPTLSDNLEVGGEYAYRVRGEAHVWRPNVIADLQHAVRATEPKEAMSGKLPQKYRDFAKAINDQNEQLMTMRGMFRLRSAEETGRKPVKLDEVEPAAEIVKRFATGAMSFGSISREAHTTLAIAMNRIGGKSNTGEGGEEADRFKPLPNGDSMRSAIKQVASGRFGVTTEYLVNSDVMQIKMAQGAKPGEGGQLPGHKVDEVIAKVRHSTPGVGLISPPPHHDIYSIEDLAQRRHGRRRCRQGARRPCHHRRLRGRHGRFPADLDQARRQPVGDRPRRDAPDAGAEPSARPHRGAGRRRSAHGPRRADRRSSRRRRVRLRHRAADRGRLHHDEEMPPQHLPGRRRHAGPGIACKIQGQARARHQLLLLRRRGGARAARRARLHQARGRHWPHRAARQGPRHPPLEGTRARLLPHLPQAGRAEVGRHPPLRAAGPRPRQGARQQADRDRAAGLEVEEGGEGRGADHQRQPLHRRHAVGQGRQGLRSRRPRRGHHLADLQGHGRPGVRRLGRQGRDARPRRRGERLRRQGAVGRQADRAPRSEVGHRAGEEHHRRQHGALRRHPRRVLLPRRRRRAVRRAQLRRLRGGRGHGRSRLRVHDRRRRRGARGHGTQLRRRHVGRHRLRARRDGRLREPLQQGDGRDREDRGQGRRRRQARQGQRRCGRARIGVRHGRHARP
jgi:glutamate synthase domain-containing protein 1